MDESPDLAANTALADAAQDTVSSAVSMPTLLRLIYRYRGFFFAEGSLFALSIAILCISAYGSLHRPYSAALPVHEEDEDDDKKDPNKKKRRRRRHHDASTAAAKQGIYVSDAILMPFMAGITLVGLYYLIQYLQDPTLLNRIMRTYTSVIGLASTGKLLADSLDFITSLVFPNVWSTMQNGQPVLFRVSAVESCQQMRQSSSDGEWSIDTTRPSPFPDRLAVLLAPTPAAAHAAWTLRRLVREEWTVRATVCGVGNAKLRVTLSTMIGALLSVGVTALYYFSPAFSRSDFLANLQGLGFCYGGLLIISCIDFAIGSLILAGLFVYDIIMVFYTPFMITVATKIDAPIKLVATSGTGAHAKSSMLGLGDIVVPGIFVCMCMRYDLHRFYARQIRHVTTQLETEVSNSADAPTTTTTTTTTATRAVKTPFIDPQGRWGDRLWTAGLWGLLFSRAMPPTSGLRAVAFPKPFFRAAIFSYIVGLGMAFAAVVVTGRGQPALFYLVPTILLGTWGWAWATGELHEMWAYTEDESADVKDVVVEVGPDGKPIEKKDEEIKEETKPKSEEDVLLFSLRAPTEMDIIEVHY